MICIASLLSHGFTAVTVRAQHTEHGPSEKEKYVIGMTEICLTFLKCDNDDKDQPFLSHGIIFVQWGKPLLYTGYKCLEAGFIHSKLDHKKR